MSPARLVIVGSSLTDVTVMVVLLVALVAPSPSLSTKSTVRPPVVGSAVSVFS